MQAATAPCGCSGRDFTAVGTPMCMSDAGDKPNMPNNVALLRAYLFDYIVGALWLIAFAAITSTHKTLVEIITSLRALVTAFSGDKPPDLVVGFAVAFAGIIIPYCVALVFNPISYQVMNTTYRLKARLSGAAAVENSTTPACGACGRPISATFAFRLITLLRRKHGEVVTHLIRTRDEFMFRATAVLPATLLIGTIASRLLSPYMYSELLAAAIAVLVFIFAAWDISEEVELWRADVDRAFREFM